MKFDDISRRGLVHRLKGALLTTKGKPLKRLNNMVLIYADQLKYLVVTSKDKKLVKEVFGDEA